MTLPVTVSSSFPLSRRWRSMCVVTSASGLLRNLGKAEPRLQLGRRKEPECRRSDDDHDDDDQHREKRAAPLRSDSSAARNGVNSSSCDFGLAAAPARLLDSPARRSSVSTRGPPSSSALARQLRSASSARCGVLASTRFLIGALFGLRAAARLDQRRLGDAFVLVPQLPTRRASGDRLASSVARRRPRRWTASSGSWCQLCLHDAQRTCRPSGGIAPSFTTYCVPQLGQVRIMLSKALFRDGERTVNRNERGLARRGALVAAAMGRKSSCQRLPNSTASACATARAPRCCATSISGLRTAASTSSPVRRARARRRCSSCSTSRSARRAAESACSARN